MGFIRRWYNSLVDEACGKKKREDDDGGCSYPSASRLEFGEDPSVSVKTQCSEKKESDADNSRDDWWHQIH